MTFPAALARIHSMNLKKIDLNEQFKRALRTMEDTSQNVFITGKAGTGKSTLLRLFRETTKKQIVVLAPTGVAALNVQGQTLHSFFRFKTDITPDKVKKLSEKSPYRNIYLKLEAIVIDEVSMVRADLLDCIDRFMRFNGRQSDRPFGGAQMILIGDLYQLPPVVTSKEREIFSTHYPSPYFFDAAAFKNFSMNYIELEKIYRQSDANFIRLLNSIRNNSATEEDLEAINERFRPDFEPSRDEFFIYLTTTNLQAQEINNTQLEKITGKVYSYPGEKRGDFESHYLPTAIDLSLKAGSQIMMLNNDSMGRWVNGSVGEIIEILTDDEPHVIRVRLMDEHTVDVTPYTWKLSRFSYDKEADKVVSETIGSFTQYPLMLAWAVTIHKSQGKTFDRVIIDIGKGTFSHGQMYVALSRCTTLDGIFLKKKLEKRHIFMDWRVVKFVTQYQYGISENELPLQKKITLLQDAISEKRQLEILYLKSNDEKSRRVIAPTFVGELEYLGKKYTGVIAYDSKRQGARTFRADRILELKTLDV